MQFHSKEKDISFAKEHEDTLLVLVDHKEMMWWAISGPQVLSLTAVVEKTNNSKHLKSFKKT